MTSTDWPMTAQQALAAIGARPEKWETVGEFRGRTFSHYQISDKGAVRSVERVISGRRLRGVQLKTRPNNSGYVLTDIRDDNGDVLTCTVHSLVLAKFDPRCKDGMPEGMEARHHPGLGPLVNAWPEALTIGTKPQNQADKAEPSAPPVPSHPCLNAPRCPGKASNPGRRCLDCVAEAGRHAAVMLRLGMPSQQVAGRLGFTSADWAYQIAVKHGGYAGSKAQARTQHPTLSQRVKLAALSASGAIPGK